MDEHIWTVAEAKANFSAVIQQAQVKGPQTITRHGRQAVVVVAAAEWERKNKRSGTLVDFLVASPLRGSRLRVKRSKHSLRTTDL